MPDLIVGQSFCRAEESVAGVVDDDIDPAEFCKCLSNRGMNCRRVRHVQKRRPKPISVLGPKIVNGFQFPQCAGDAVATRKELFGHLTAEAAVDAGDEPGARHGIS
jgi:hypothetical protein